MPGGRSIEWTVSGITLKLLQEQYSVGTDGSDGTGWRMWNSGMVMSKYIEANFESLFKPRFLAAHGAAAGSSGGRPVRVLDMSAGPGLLGLSCSVIAAVKGLDVEVVLSEMPNSSLDQLASNVATVNKQMVAMFGDRYRPARAAPFTWGEPSAELWLDSNDRTGSAAMDSPQVCQPNFDIVLVSDCLFIAVRDTLYTQLLGAMEYACSPPQLDKQSDQGTLLLFAYEERCVMEERAFLAHVSINNSTEAEETNLADQPPTACSDSFAWDAILREGVFEVEEVDPESLDLSCVETDEGDLGDLFHEPVPIRLLRFTLPVPKQ
eukprot:SAG31_NODE_433_length_15750_cov_6.132579_12_plen_321_part_00